MISCLETQQETNVTNPRGCSSGSPPWNRSAGGSGQTKGRALSLSAFFNLWNSLPQGYALKKDSPNQWRMLARTTGWHGTAVARDSVSLNSRYCCGPHLRGFLGAAGRWTRRTFFLGLIQQDSLEGLGLSDLKSPLIDSKVVLMTWEARFL